MVKQHTQCVSARSGGARRLFQGLTLAAMLAVGAASQAQSDSDEELRAQMAEAQEQLDEAAQRIAELSRQMAGGEMTRVFERVSTGHRKAMLGVRIGDAGDGEGVLIDSVTPEGPAEKAGVQAGDVIKRFNRVDLTELKHRDAMNTLLDSLRELEPNDVASLSVEREGREVEIDVTTESATKSLPRFGVFRDGEGNMRQLEEMLEGLAVNIPEIHAQIMIADEMSDLDFSFDMGELEDLKQLPKRLEEAMGNISGSGPIIAMLGGSGGLSHQFRFAPVTPGLGNYFGVNRGVLVTAVPDDDPLGLQEGDVLLSLNGKAVNSKHDVHAMFAQADEGETVSVELVRQRESITVDVTAPKGHWGGSWECSTEKDDERGFERCRTKDGKAFTFTFSDEDE